MNKIELLAKSDGTTLQQHSEDVVYAAKKISSLLNHRLDLSRAALYHDFGKASIYFQTKMHGKQPSEWYRHELVSFVIAVSINLPKKINEFELAAILTHHKNLNKIEKDGTPGLLAWINDTNSESLRHLLQKELNPNWLKLKELVGNLTTLRHKKSVELIDRIHETIMQHSIWDEKGYKMAIYRAILVAADHLASSKLIIPHEGETINKQSIELYAKQHIKNWKAWNYIQQQSEKKSENGSALLIAPTGTGKTEASILWLLKNRKKGERIFYVLPYQVSINAMAKRLSNIFPAEDGSKELYNNNNISILHSNTSLAYLQDALNDEVEIKEGINIAYKQKEAARKIYSPIKVTTVYQLLNIFFGKKFFEIGILELTNSLIIFDEIHAYDGHTLGLILVMLKYLRKLDARIFIMTATLPNKVKDTLRT